MNRTLRATSRLATAAIVLMVLTAAVRPAVFSQTAGGLWEVSRSDGGRRSICIPEPVVLAQYELSADERSTVLAAIARLAQAPVRERAQAFRSALIRRVAT